MKKVIRIFLSPLFYTLYIVGLVLLWLFWMLTEDDRETFEGNKS